MNMHKPLFVVGLALLCGCAHSDQMRSPNAAACRCQVQYEPHVYAPRFLDQRFFLDREPTFRPSVAYDLNRPVPRGGYTVPPGESPFSLPSRP
jgi:hypothetical protein